MLPSDRHTQVNRSIGSASICIQVLIKALQGAQTSPTHTAPKQLIPASVNLVSSSNNMMSQDAPAQVPREHCCPNGPTVAGLATSMPCLARHIFRPHPNCSTQNWVKMSCGVTRQ
eukprot:4116141-Amphidinium_carterae.1